jgi:hypothetical protein
MAFVIYICSLHNQQQHRKPLKCFAPALPSRTRFPYGERLRGQLWPAAAILRERVRLLDVLQIDQSITFGSAALSACCSNNLIDGVLSSIWAPLAGVISRTAIAVSFGCTYGASAHAAAN